MKCYLLTFQSAKHFRIAAFIWSAKLEKLLDEKTYYCHPDKRLHVCVGVSPIVRRDRKLWLFHSPISSIGERYTAETLELLQEEMEVNGYILPSKFGHIEEDVHVRGVFVYDKKLTLRQGAKGQRSNSTITFQFDKSSFVSFTNAMENAIRCLALIKTLKQLAK